MHVVDTPGAKTVTGHETAPTATSVTTTESRVTLPVFVTTNSYAIGSPSALTSVTSADFAKLMPGAEIAGIVTEELALTAGPVGGSAVTLALFTT